jgi:hypothetical protein
MNKNYFNDLNSRLSQALGRLGSLIEEIYGPQPTTEEQKADQISPSITNLMDLSLWTLTEIHAQLEQLENIIKAK